MTADIRALQAAGKLEQRCPSCGLIEAAGAYCTACEKPTGEPHWRRAERTAAQVAATATAGASRAPATKESAGGGL